MAILPVTHLAFAQEATEGTQLETIVVKGKRTGNRAPGGTVADTPLASETTADEIAKKEVRDLSDLGNTTEPGLDFIRTRPGKTGGLYLRGMTGPRVATLVDDIPLPFMQNSARTGSSSPATQISGPADSFDFSSLSGVDVVRGADSSRIGGGALAGAIVARTLEPEDLIGEGKDWGGVAKTGYDSEDRSFGGSLAVAKKIENTSILFQGAYTKGHESENQGTADIIGPSRTKPNPTDYVQYNLLLKFRHQLAGGHTIGLTAERFDRESETNLLTMQNTAGATAYMPGRGYGWDDTRRERVSLDYMYNSEDADSLVDEASLRLYWQRLNKIAGTEGYRTGNNYYLRDNDMVENDYGVIGSSLSEFETGNVKHEVRLSGNLTTFNTKQFIDVRPAIATAVAQADMPDVKGTSIGLSLDDKMSIGDSGFSVTPGMRFDWHDYRPQDSARFQANTGYAIFGLPESHSDFRFSPKLLASYQLTPAVELFAQWSMAYRAPTIDELYGNFTNPVGGYASIGNPNLKSETGHGFEIGANWDTGDLTGGVTLFHNRYKNFIESETIMGLPPGMRFTYRNLPQATISGIELKSRKEFRNGMFVEGSLAYTYGESENSSGQKYQLRSVAPFKGIASVGYEQETWGTQLTGIFSEGMYRDNNASTFDAPGYGVFNLTGWWEPEQTKGLRIQAGVYNLFDKTYWNPVGVATVNPAGASSSANQPTGFYTEAGRTFKISLTQRF